MLEWMISFTRLDDLTRNHTIWWLLGCCMLLLILWFPALAYPTWADTAYYALLGENMWRHGTYALDGVPHAKFLPLHAFYAYPFTALFGYGTGMKVATLVAGWGVIIASYLLLKEIVSKRVGLMTAALLALQPAFLLTTMLGSSDPLFAALLLTSAFFFVKAERMQHLYLWSGILLGLACLTRYNGIPVFGVYAVWMLWKRRPHLVQPWSWTGATAGVAVLSAWFIRNALVFGNPLHTEYTVQQSTGPSMAEQITRNILYYLDPLHSVLPILFALAVWGMIRFGKKQSFLFLLTLGSTALALIWWARGARYLVPVLPVVLAFSVMGYDDLYRRTTYKTSMMTLTAILLIITHAPVFCAYNYGSCNAWMDKHIGLLPSFLGVSPEGMTSWNAAKDYINGHIPPDATVATGLDDAELAVLEHTFRSDLTIVNRTHAQCPYYDLTQETAFDGVVLFASENQPTARVTKVECR